MPSAGRRVGLVGWYRSDGAAESAHFEPQLALLDLGLLVTGGFELAQRFAEHPRLRTTTLIAVTGYGQPRDRESSERAGFVAHLVKPVDADELRTVLGSVARSRAGDR